MAKVRSKFICQSCGASYTKWAGRCENCGEWNSLLEQEVQPEAEVKSALARGAVSGKKLAAVSINEIEPSDAGSRLKTGFPELDNVLGGGILLGGVALLASSSSANDIAKTIEEDGYDLVIVDSIQTLSMAEISSAPGTVSQVSNCGNLIIRAAKASGTAVIIVGHVTKDGTLAGPKILEHLVDVVLNFEGDRYGGFKTIRAVKNRFGSTTEVAIFEMAAEGLVEVKNPSEALLSERQNTDGSIIMATIEGTRPLLVEIQALVNPTNFGYPKRTASGFDLNRLNLLIAVLEKRTKLSLQDKDIFINVVGGLKLNDSAADLAICMAIASAAAGRKLDEKVVVFGEIGLGGEIRSVIAADRRIAEAKKLGFKNAIGPATIKDKFVLPVKDLRSALVKYMNNK